MISYIFSQQHICFLLEFVHYCWYFENFIITITRAFIVNNFLELETVKELHCFIKSIIILGGDLFVRFFFCILLTFVAFAFNTFWSLVTIYDHIHINVCLSNSNFCCCCWLVVALLFHYFKIFFYYFCLSFKQETANIFLYI